MGHYRIKLKKVPLYKLLYISGRNSFSVFLRVVIISLIRNEFQIENILNNFIVISWTIDTFIRFYDFNPVCDKQRTRKHVSMILNTNIYKIHDAMCRKKRDFPPQPVTDCHVQ